MTRFLFLLLFVLPTILLHGQSSSAKVKVYWDVSLSMEQRNLEKEILFLQEYVKTNKVKSIILVEFSNGIKSAKEFSLVDDSLSNFSTYLSRIGYDGISDMDFLLKEYSNIPSLLFTDGYPNFTSLKLNYGKSKMNVICATSACNPNLEKLAIYSYGNFHILPPELKSTNQIRIANTADEVSKPIIISGLVNDINGPLADAAIIIKGTNRGTLSVADGSFAIKANKGDSILVKFLGKSSVALPVSISSKYLEIFLADTAEILDEVVLTQKDKIKWLPKEKVLGYGGIQIIEKKDLTISSGSINTSLAGKVAGVQTNKEGFSKAIIRGFSSIEYSNFPLVIVDGAPMPRADNTNADILNNINPNDVVQVKVLKGLAATNRYGAEGSNGVILVKTIYGEVNLEEKKESKRFDTALLRDNNFSGVLEVPRFWIDKTYINNLEEEASVVDSYQLYLRERDRYLNDPYYFINVHDLFQSSDEKIAEGILNSALEVSDTSIPPLRTIAYYHQKAGRYQQAVKIYNQIVKLDSTGVQPYRDLANAYVQAGDLQEGLDAYLDLLKHDFKVVLEPKSIADIVKLEIKNLINRKGKEMNISKVSSSFKSAPRYDARILLEWNDPEANFEIEFISPDTKISKWSHTLENNYERMQSEKLFGFNIEESLLSQSQKGDWYINVRTINLKEKSPLFIKCTVYYKYGQAGQFNTQEIFSFNSGSNERIITKITIH